MLTEAQRRLDHFAPCGRVLEVAAGTGNWTERLARHAERIVAVDASDETLAINRAKLAERAHLVDYVTADLFSWQPDERFDVVFMSFWLTHVPNSRFDGFWQMVHAALEPAGRVFIIDNCHPRRVAAVPNSPVRLPYRGSSRDPRGRRSGSPDPRRNP